MFPPEGRRWRYVAVLVLLATAVFEVLWAPPRPSPDPRFPELRGVDEELERSLRRAWPRGFDRPDAEQKREAFVALARARGVDAARAIFRILVENCRGRADGGDFYGEFYQDEEREVVGCVLGELADADLRRLMVRALPERDFHPSFRRALAVALCRPDNDLVPLLDRILDRQEDNTFRQRLLVRLPRLEVPAPRRLRELLYQPFGYLDLHAAATLARMGDLEAPSLVLEAFDYVGWDDGMLYHLVLATERFTDKEIEFHRRTILPGGGRDVLEAWYKERAAGHKAVLAEWLEGREPDTAFERAHRGYLASEQRRRELSLETFEDVLRAGEDFDLAAAALLLTGYKTDALLQIDRLSRLLGRKLRDVTEPAQRVAILNRWLLKRRMRVDFSVRESGRLSNLPHVFGQDAGNCVGYSTLYLGLAERLDLPLHGVLVPGHCFVRWDDGRVRRNIETTDLGKELPDRHYRAGAVGNVELGNRTKREVLSTILSNYAATQLFYSDFTDAGEAANRAIRLDPTNAAAYSNYAAALYHSDLPGRRRILEELREVLRLQPGNADTLLLTAEIYMEFEHHERALGLLEEAVGIERSPRTLAARARCLARLGRLTEAKDSLGPGPIDPALRRAEIEVLIRERPEETERIIAEKTVGLEDRLVVLTDAAAVLVELDEPTRALAVLDQVADRANRAFKDEWAKSGFRVMPDARSFSRTRQGYHLVRAKALHALGRRAAAHAALTKAEALGGSSRLMLEVRDLLR
ncbi:MAG: transglutaminase family protein [Planctomycetota bacterium]